MRQIMQTLSTLPVSIVIDHFRITFGLFFKASLGANPFIWKLVFIHMQMKTNFHMKRWAPGLALKKRPKVIRKWPILATRTHKHITHQTQQKISRPYFVVRCFLTVNIFLRLTVKIVSFLRLTAKFLAILRLTVNPIETLKQLKRFQSPR